MFFGRLALEITGLAGIDYLLRCQRRGIRSQPWHRLGPAISIRLGVNGRGANNGSEQLLRPLGWRLADALAPTIGGRGCVVGCARSDGDFNNPRLKRTRAVAEKSGNDDFNDASLKGARAFSEKPGAEPIALLRGRTSENQ